MNHSASSDRPTDRVRLDEPRRLSQSLLWQLQRRYFTRQGIDAWRQGIVPQYITSNPITAYAYAQVVTGFLRDCRAANRPFDASQPLYLIELGAGSGRFAYHFLNSFRPPGTQAAGQPLSICYVMTDLAERTVDYWRSQPDLQPFVEAGQLDFACFDAEQPRALTLLHSGQRLSPDTLTNPLVLIANYFFDSIARDSFTIEGGQLFENLVSLSTPQPVTDLDQPGLLDQIDIAYRPNPASGDYYAEPEFNQILQRYQASLPDTTFLFPVMAMRCLNYFNQPTERPLLVLTGDKGHTDATALVDLNVPWLHRHGSFSMMVNYHALSQYISQRQGHSLQASHGYRNLNVAAWLFGPAVDYHETRQAFESAVETGGPDEFYTLKQGLENHYNALTLEQLLAWLRLSRWDADILLDCVPALIAKIQSNSDSLTASLKTNLQAAIEQVWANYYFIGEKRDLAFYLGTLSQLLAFEAAALTYYDHSLTHYGPNLSTYYNMSACHYNQQHYSAALECIDQVLALDPDYEPAQAMRERIQAKLEDDPQA
jgi:tetratricopeptide (TPR) repeat protein